VTADAFTVNSKHARTAYHAFVDQICDEHKYLTFPPPRIGMDRSLDQNALFHVWLTLYVAHLDKKTVKEVTAADLASIKRDAKKQFLMDHPQCKPWMVHELRSRLTPAIREDYTSSKSWKVKEMHLVLEWLQNIAAIDGCLLESMGQFAKLQRKEV